MIIEMDHGEKKEFEHFKNGEGSIDAVMFFDGTNRILRATVKPGNTIGFHKHEGNCEIVYMISGKAKMLMDDSVEYLEAGQCHYCPEGHAHSLINEGPEDVEIFAVVPKQ